MTRKDYVSTAEILRDFSPGESMIDDKTFENLVDQFAAMFANDNPNFDADKFYKASGL